MKNKILYFFSMLVLVGFSSCYEDPASNFTSDGGVVAQYDNVQTGFYDLVDINNASIAFDLSTLGVNATSVTIFKSLNGGAPVEHAVVTAIPSTVTISAADAVAGTGAAIGDLALGDAFDFTFVVGASDGRSLTTGGSPLNIKVSCASDLAGTYSASSTGTSTDSCCPAEVTVTSEVVIEATGGGNYSMSDFSGGLYLEWYDVYGITATTDSPGSFQDVCNTITIVNTNEPFQTAVTGTGSVDAATGVITFSWENGYADVGTVTLTPQ